MADTLIVAGSLAQKPGRGGHTWVLLQYLLGFRRLGWNVLFLDRLDPEMCVDASGQPCPLEQSENLRYFLDVTQHFDLEGTFALLTGYGEGSIGLPRPQVLECVRNAALLLNINGFLIDEEILSAAPRRVFLDIDPGFAQIWHNLGLHDPFRGHDDYVTIGENIGQADCAIPTCGLNWLTTRQPVVLDYWPVANGGGRSHFTSIASWRGAYGPLEYEGKTYGLRAHEFRRFVELPELSGQQFELALDIHPNEVKDLHLLYANGWSLVNPRMVAGDPWRYRSYIQESMAELSVAKNIYVQTNSGWFSDRSICYLASGKPVVVQDTGLKRHVPTSTGLLTFTTLAEAVDLITEVTAHYDDHARAARAIAEDFFDSDTVLSRLLSKLGVA